MILSSINFILSCTFLYNSSIIPVITGNSCGKRDQKVRKKHTKRQETQEFLNLLEIPVHYGRDRKQEGASKTPSQKLFQTMPVT